MISPCSGPGTHRASLPSTRTTIPEIDTLGKNFSKSFCYGSRPMNPMSLACSSASSGTVPAGRIVRWRAACRRRLDAGQHPVHLVAIESLVAARCSRHIPRVDQHVAEKEHRDRLLDRMIASLRVRKPSRSSLRIVEQVWMPSLRQCHAATGSSSTDGTRRQLEARARCREIAGIHSTMWRITSRASQPAHGEGLCHAARVLRRLAVSSLRRPGDSARRSHSWPLLLHLDNRFDCTERTVSSASVNSSDSTSCRSAVRWTSPAAHL